jgi:hypothetical protein
MKNFIDDEIVEAATDAYLKSTPTHGQNVKFKDMRAALEATLPLIGAKLAEDIEKMCCDESAAPRICELTGAKP